jgi:Protein of unknown function DUF262/Protein of unknown function (DUF1524)
VATTNFKTTNSTFRQLIGNGLTYRIPTFQRDYSWGEEEWEDLWADLVATLADQEPAHYMGYLVLQSDDEKTFDVIDGQQRLTTLTLLVLAALKHLQRLVDGGDDADANRQRIDELRRTFVGSLDPVSLATKSKLTLNRNNDEYFQKYLVPLERLPQRRRRVSENALRKGFEWFEKRLGEWLRTRTGALGMELAQFVSSMSDRLFFTVINVTDELNAYKVFETLNARGVKLSSTDLLKNYLFSILHRDRAHREEELSLLEQRWESLVGRLEDEDFPEFLRVHWLSTGRRFVRHSELFKQVRLAITDRASVFGLVRDLDDDLDRYLSLRDPLRSTLAPSIQKLAQQLRLFQVSQPLPLLLAAQRRLDASDFEKVLRACVVISVRYNVISGFSPGDQEPVFADVARGIADGRLTNATQVIAALARIYPPDEQFELNFVEKVFSRGKQKLIRHLLCDLEVQFSQVRVDPDSDVLSIEHVLPQAPGAGWDEFSEQDLESMSWRLGNLVLMRKSQNSGLGNATWAEKRPVLLQSEYGLTRGVDTRATDGAPAETGEVGRRALANSTGGQLTKSTHAGFTDQRAVPRSLYWHPSVAMAARVRAARCTATCRRKARRCRSPRSPICAQLTADSTPHRTWSGPGESRCCPKSDTRCATSRAWCFRRRQRWRRSSTERSRRIGTSRR